MPRAEQSKAAHKPKKLADLEVWSVIRVRPDGNFRPKSLNDRPRKWKYHRPLWPTVNRKEAIEVAAKYNRRATRQKWSTWAIVERDEAYAEALRECDRLNAKLDDEPRVRVDTGNWFSSKGDGRYVAVYLDSHGFLNDGHNLAMKAASMLWQAAFEAVSRLLDNDEERINTALATVNAEQPREAAA